LACGLWLGLALYEVAYSGVCAPLGLAWLAVLWSGVRL